MTEILSNFYWKLNCPIGIWIRIIFSMFAAAFLLLRMKNCGLKDKLGDTQPGGLASH